jgi:hypothetical protein
MSKKIHIAIFVTVLILSLAATCFFTLILGDESYMVYPEGGTIESSYTFYGSTDTLVITEENTHKRNFKDKVYSFFK